MAETLEKSCTDPRQKKWHWYNVMNDLKEQGGLEGVTINPLTVQDHCCAGETASGNKFCLTWLHDAYFLLTMDRVEEALVEAFSRVLEYKPFCSYNEPESGLPTYEWDKKDPNGRYGQLMDAEKPQLRWLK